MPTESVAKFERYSDDIRHSMRLANRQAKWHLHSLIDTPHLLIALVQEQAGLAGYMLRQRGLTARSVCRAVHKAIPRQWSLHIRAKLPLTPQVQSVVDHAVNHAVAEKHDSVGTGGILLAMLRHDPATVSLLDALRVDRVRLERDLAILLHRFMVEAPGQNLNMELPD